MSEQKTIYSKIVNFKKKFIKRTLVPRRLGFFIDNFFNNLHNIFIQSLDTGRDVLIKCKDVSRDVLIKYKDNSKDIIVRSRDVMRDKIIVTKDTTKDIAIRSFDTLRDKSIVTKDLTRDIIIRSSRILVENESAIKKIIKNIINLLRPKNLKYILLAIIQLISNSKYKITEHSDKEAVTHLQRIIANSENVRLRIKKYYNRDSTVIYPPAQNAKEIFSEENSDYWLSVNRITPEKRIDIQINCFKEIKNERLVIVGGYENNSQDLAISLFKDCPSNISYLGNVDGDTLSRLYANCKGLITTALDEDFGMTAIEAMSYGKPVIAPNEGGYKESVVQGETGILINDIDSAKLRSTIYKLSGILKDSPRQYIDKCLSRASEFSEEKFLNHIQNQIPQNILPERDKTLVFIVGIPRSGTTWLWGLLSSHRDIEAITKTDFDPNLDLIETNMLYERSMQEIINTIKSKSKNIIIEKTPDHLLKLEMILSMFPHAKIIHILRDPRSVFASYKYSVWNRKIEDVHEWLNIYKKRIEMYEKYSSDRHILTVHYEDLYKKPNKILKSILSFINAKPIDIKKMIKENSSTSKSKGAHGFRIAKTDSWKYELTPFESNKIQDELSRYPSLKRYWHTSFWTKICKKKLKPDQTKKLVFIVGIPRSGTTWLWKLLSLHKDVSTITKSDFEDDCTDTLTDPRRLKETDMFNKYSLKRIMEVMHKKDGQVLIEKTPLHLLKLDLIKKHFPDAIIVHIIRDPISVYASYKFTEFEEWHHRDISVEKWIEMYKGFFKKFSPQLANKNILTISYEDMIRDTEKTLRDVYTFIGLSTYNLTDAINKNQFEKSFPRISKKRSVNSLKSQLTPDEIKTIQSSLKEETEFMKRQLTSKDDGSQANTQ
jgi:glycosyltransferase involved in cell wall biosynthesis